MAETGRIYKRGAIYFVAYTHGGHEFRESTHSRDIADVKRWLEKRLEEYGPSVPAEPGGGVPFEALVRLYLEEYEVRQFRTSDTAGGRVKNLVSFFGAMSATAITTADIRRYQATRRRAGAAMATVNRETAALGRMFRLALATGRLATMPYFPDGLPENPPRQGFFEHAEYLAVRSHLPPPYQDVLDFAYYSGWRHREITELTWEEIDWNGGVIRLNPARTLFGQSMIERKTARFRREFAEIWGRFPRRPVTPEVAGSSPVGPATIFGLVREIEGWVIRPNPVLSENSAELIATRRASPFSFEDGIRLRDGSSGAGPRAAAGETLRRLAVPSVAA
jgi:hypothetical protein